MQLQLVLENLFHIYPDSKYASALTLCNQTSLPWPSGVNIDVSLRHFDDYCIVLYWSLDAFPHTLQHEVKRVLLQGFLGLLSGGFTGAVFAHVVLALRSSPLRVVFLE